MPVTDEQVAALRAFLALNPTEAGGLTRQLVEADHLDGYGELVYAAFVTAARRRFSPTCSVPDVIRFVAAVRTQLLEDGVDIHPRTSEILIRRAIGDRVTAELDKKASARAQLLLLGELISDERLAEAGLDAFLTQARSLADQWLPDLPTWNAGQS
jgi:hypothetical protein